MMEIGVSNLRADAPIFIQVRVKFQSFSASAYGYPLYIMMKGLCSVAIAIFSVLFYLQFFETCTFL